MFYYTLTDDSGATVDDSTNFCDYFATEQEAQEAGEAHCGALIEHEVNLGFNKQNYYVDVEEA